MEAPYLGSDVRGSRRGRTTHFFPFTPQSFLSPSPGTPAPARLGRLSTRLASASAALGSPRAGVTVGRGAADRRQPAEGLRLGNPRFPAAAGRVCAEASSVTGRVIPGAAPPSAPAPAPALSFPPGPSREGSQGSPGRRAGALLLGALPQLHPGPAGVHGRPQSACSLLCSPGASPDPGSPRLLRREFSLMSTGRGWPGRVFPGLRPGGGGGGQLGASQRPDFTRSCWIPSLGT